MGAQNKRSGTIGDLSSIEAKRRQLQDKLDNEKSLESRKRLGQFATPYGLAQEIISYGLNLQQEDEISFLEPAFGTGAFYSALVSECDKQAKSIKCALGIEIDEDFYTAAKDLWGNTILNLENIDFTAADCSEKVNLLVSNPPYVRHHYLSKNQKTKLSSMIKNETGLTISGLAGLYCHFILSAHKWLAPDAICGWLIPCEFMDVNYGKTIKEYLLNHVRLLRVHMYNPENSKFDDALVSSCVIWYKNETISGNYDVEFSYGENISEPVFSKSVDKNTLIKSRKWSRYSNAQSNYVHEHTDNIPTLGDFFTIKRGLATGDNNFFILSKQQIDALDLDMGFFTPILPSPRHLKCNEIFGDANGHPRLDTQYYLLSCTLPEEEIRTKHPTVWNYLKSGEETTAHKYLCRSRKVWYYQENRTATPFLCSYMGRTTNSHDTPFRFILNHTKAIATNSYLMLYPKGFLENIIAQHPEILYRVWETLATITASDLECEGRAYGGGLKKIEPKELAYVKCPQLAELLLFAS